MALKKFISAILMTLSLLGKVYADPCHMEPTLNYDENGMVSFPIEAGWALMNRSMDYFTNEKDCFAEAEHYKLLIERDAAASKLVKSLKVTFSSQSTRLDSSKTFEISGGSK